MILQQSKIDWFVNAFGGNDGWILIGCGIMTLIWFLYESKRRGGFLRPKKEEWEISTTIFMKTIIFLGIFLGLIAIGTAIVGMVYNIPPSPKAEMDTNDKFTSIFLLILGIIMFIKPLADIPWATILGVLAGTGAVLLIIFQIPDETLEQGAEYINVDLKWILLAVFLIIFGLVFAMFKLAFGAIEFISKLFSWPPVSLLLTIICFVQGIALVSVGWSISYI